MQIIWRQIIGELTNGSICGFSTHSDGLMSKFCVSLPIQEQPLLLPKKEKTL